MNIDSIKNGIVIDHIKAGNGMKIYQLLKLDRLDCSVALVRNVQSSKMGKKDIIKIDCDIDINMDILGYVDSGVTVDIIKDCILVEKKKIGLPEKLVNIITCKNPRCITATEQELDNVFKLTDREKKVYRCIYCEGKAE
ncbi:MAG: aspartate carbamoyltransferase regulatory subunit [Ruminococcaceae bacterium]|nr:aspartate carbamoyltransferase regulatory subunit [Oscillospiraceae bacterium]